MIILPRLIGLCLALGLFASTLAVADSTLPSYSAHRTVGSVNCATSTCHGAITPWEDSSILKTEYITWANLDRHASAYNVLLGEKAKGIARKLGMTEPAHQSSACLDCHAHNPDARRRGGQAPLSDGVSCEACHGPAGDWLGSHKNDSHANNLRRGMYPTNNPAAQARLCLSCHVGDKTRFVTHRMMGAGHPRLTFELATFTAIQPPHFRIDRDWQRRKGEYNPIKSWAVGQVIAAQLMLNSFADPELGRNGIFPELVLFDCHACHRPMSEQRWTPRLDIGPGRIRLNDSALLMVRSIVRVIDSSSAAVLDKRVSDLHAAVSGERLPGKPQPQETARQLAADLEVYIFLIEKQKFDSVQLKQVFLALIAEAAEGRFSDAAGAEQAYMAIANLAAALYNNGGLKSAASVNVQLAELRQALSNDEQYQPDVFARQLANLKNVVSQEN